MSETNTTQETRLKTFRVAEVDCCIVCPHCKKPTDQWKCAHRDTILTGDVCNEIEEGCKLPISRVVNLDKEEESDD